MLQNRSSPTLATAPVLSGSALRSCRARCALNTHMYKGDAYDVLVPAKRNITTTIRVAIVMIPRLHQALCRGLFLLDVPPKPCLEAAINLLHGDAHEKLFRRRASLTWNNCGGC